jgi:replicative DNA helicase
MGKSTLAWQIARNVASQKMKAIFFSLEVSIPSMWAKAACGVCGLRWKDIRSGEATKDDLDRLVEATASLMQRYDDYLLIDDRVSTSKTIWAAVEKHKPDLVVVDHLRLVADNGDNENNRLGEISQRLKDMAKSFNCQVLCLAQLNRNVENREDKRPILADLRESGKIEENADQILMLYRDDYYDQTEGKFKKTQPTELLIRKFRDDIMNNRITLTFDAEHQWFESYGK